MEFLDDPRAVVVALAFGLLLGWGLGRRPQDRVPVLWASAVATVIGVAVWLLRGGTPGLEPISLTLGGITVGVVVLGTGRRRAE